MAHLSITVTPKLRRLFFDRIQIGRDDGCWLWTGPVQTNGYGYIDHRLAHRVSWEMHQGPIPEDLLVLHECDTPRCVNPSHLFLGTHMDNAQDKIQKGRSRNGATGPLIL